MVLASLAATAVRAGRHHRGGDSAARSRRGAPALLRVALAGFVLAGLSTTVPVASGAVAAPMAAGAPTGAGGERGYVLTADSMPAGKAPPFTISGSVNGLAPGVGSQLPLSITNPFDFPIRVVTLTVAAGDAGGSCLGSNLQVQPLPGPVQVPARGSATALLAMTLSNRSPDVCQQATWPLTYGGQAIRVSSSAGGGGTSTGPSGSQGSGPGASGGAAGGSPIGSPGQTGNGPSSTGLAFTGLTLWILIAAAAALLISGAAILLAQHRRRRRLAAERMVAQGSWAQ
jgi:hypothetical protein